MLVLTRKPGEAIIINNGQIRIVIVEVRADRVRVGIEAPKEVSVHRAEVQDRVDKGQSFPPKPPRKPKGGRDAL